MQKKKCRNAVTLSTLKLIELPSVKSDSVRFLKYTRISINQNKPKL